MKAWYLLISLIFPSIVLEESLDTCKTGFKVKSRGR